MSMFGGNFTDPSMGYIHYMLNPPWWVILGTLAVLLYGVNKEATK